MVKMKKPGKRRALTASWEGPYQFVGHADGKGNFDFEEGCQICIIQDADGRQWERSRRDLQIYYVPLDLVEGFNFLKKGGVTYVTGQGVTEQNFCGCAFGVNTKIADQNFRDYLAASFIDENGGIYPFWEKINVGFAWDAWGIAIWLCGMG